MKGSIIALKLRRQASLEEQRICKPNVSFKGQLLSYRFDMSNEAYLLMFRPTLYCLLVS